MKYIKIALILLILVLSIGFVSANDDNSTAEPLLVSEESSPISDIPENDTEKEIPEISISSSQAYCNESIDIYLKDQDNNPLVNKILTTTINKKTDNYTTDSKGKISLKLDFKPGKYLLNVKFIGNDTLENVSQNFNIKILKFNSVISPVNTKVVKGTYFYAVLKGQNGEKLTGQSLIFKVNGNSYNHNTDKNGKAGLKVNLDIGKYSFTVTFKGNDYYNSVSKTFNLIVPATTTISIGNTKLLTNGYLRIYLKSSTPSAVSKKTVKITIGSKTFKRTSNSEGIIIFKPKMSTSTLKITVKFDGTSNVVGCSAQKLVKGIKGNVKNPFKAKISIRNGIPDVDLMPGNYALSNGNSTYTLTKAQYKDVIQRDSYCLYLKNKLPKFTFFKSKAEPKLNHIIKREKWNVIERAINTKIVLKNKKNYWPKQIKVSLMGKSYTYCEVRDIQNTGYTCGPTSASMCTQVLKNYFNEKYLGNLAGSNSNSGSSTKGLKKALEKKNFKCTMYYKSSYKKAIKQLRKGGCALVFHTWNHYVSILDISKDGKKVLVGNPSGDYNHGSHNIPTNWLTVKYMKARFNDYDTSGLIVKLNYNLKKSAQKKLNNFYSSMGAKWPRKNVFERIPDIGM